MQISVIATVFNEGESLRGLLNSLVAQTVQPDEVVIADGGSTDGTLAILREYADTNRLPLKILLAPGSNISQGRNTAIRAAAGPIIAVTDAGVRLANDWLEKLVIPIKSGKATSAGFFLPASQKPFELVMGATVLPSVEDIDPQTFLPSSRSVAFLRESWRAVGGYPEWLDYCEDLVFDFALIDRHGPFPFVPDAVVYFRPRGNFKSFFLQYYRYARGDGKADLWRERHLVRYATYLVGIPIIGWLAIRRSPWFLLLYVLGGAYYVHRPLQRLAKMWKTLSGWQKTAAALVIPVIRITGDLAKMIGYPVGLWWRWNASRRPVIVDEQDK